MGTAAQFPGPPGPSDQRSKAEQQQQQHQESSTAAAGSSSSSISKPTPSALPPSWFQVGGLVVVLLVDGAAMLTFWVGSGEGRAFKYDAPGSVTWDLCLVGLLRVVLMLGLAFAFDAFALNPRRRRARRKVTMTNTFLACVTGAGISPTASSSSSSTTTTVGTDKKPKPAPPASPIRWMERVGRTLALCLTGLSLVFLMVKCLTRLIVGIGPDDSMAGFWGCVAASAVLVCVDYLALKRHLRHVKRWAYHRHREALVRKQGTWQESLLAREEADVGNGGRARQRSSDDDTGDGGDESTSASEEVEDEGKEDREDEAHLRELWAGLQGLDDAEAADAAAAAAVEGGSEAGHATYKDLLSLARDDWHLISLAFVFLLGAAVGQVLIPHYTGVAIDAVVSEEGAKAFQHAMFMLVLCAAICGVCTGLRGGIFTVVGARVNRRIRDMLFQSLLRQEVGFYDTTKTGDLSSRLSSDCTKVGDQVSLNVNFFLRSLVQAVGTLIFMFIQSWKLSLVAFVSVPAIVVMSKVGEGGREGKMVTLCLFVCARIPPPCACPLNSTTFTFLGLILTTTPPLPHARTHTQIYGQYIRKLSKATQERLAQANSIAEECLSTMPTVRSFACGPAEGRLYRGKLDEYYALNKQEARAYAAYAVATTLLPNLVTALVLFYGGQLVLNQDGLTSGQLVSFLLLLGSLSEGFSNMGSIFSSITQALGAADKVFELIRRPPKSTPSPEPPLAPPTCRGEVELRDVVFRYPARPARPVLHKLNMIAKPGQVVALVGPSGGGKSSCVALLENFYEPEGGMVLLDGRKVQEYDPHWFHRHVSIVSQEPVLYARSIRQNILFGLEGEPDEPTEEEIRQAAVLAGAHEFIIGLSEGYDTQVGERGVCLSGGQKQRIAIARALCRKPRVLLLDEATSALVSTMRILCVGVSDG